MNDFDMNSIPELVKNKTITKKQAMNKIWTSIYFHPFHFGITGLDEDQISEFLLCYHDRLENLIDQYDMTKCSFMGYLRNSLELMRHTWIRQYLKKENSDEIEIEPFNEQYYIHDTNFLFNEKEFKIAQENPQIDQKQKRLKIAKITALILLLKNCHQIDDQIIKNVAYFTNISISELHERIERMKELTRIRTINRERIIKRRDNAFYFHRKYGITLQKTPQNSNGYINLLKQYYTKTKSWIKQNTLLTHRYQNSPSNEMIATELGTTARQISFYLKQAQKDNSSFKIETQKFMNHQHNNLLKL